MNREDPRKLIIGVLKSHPEGLTIASIAQSSGLHRHTSTKYIHELIGAGAIIQRCVGAAKLCYLKMDVSEETNLLRKLEIRRSAHKYNLKIVVSVAIIAFLLSGVSILAYENNSLNETLSDNISLNTSPITASLILNDSNISQIIETAIENSSNRTVETNDSLIPLIIANETSIENNESYDNTTIIEIPEESHPKFDVILDYPQKITRGEEFKIRAIVTNIGSLTAKNIEIVWHLPENSEITSNIENCENLEPNINCVSEINAKTNLFTNLGKNDVKIVINYEE